MMFSSDNIQDQDQDQGRGYGHLDLMAWGLATVRPATVRCWRRPFR